MLLLADETVLTTGLRDLLKERVELKVLQAHQPEEEITAHVLDWQPDVILLTSLPAASLPCPWEWVRRLKHKHCYLIRLPLQDNSIDVCDVQTLTITDLEALVRLIAARPASDTNP